MEGKEYINAWLKTHPEYETDDDEMFYDDEDEEENEDELWDAKLTAHHYFYNQASTAKPPLKYTGPTMVPLLCL